MNLVSFIREADCHPLAQVLHREFMYVVEEGHEEGLDAYQVSGDGSLHPLRLSSDVYYQMYTPYGVAASPDGRFVFWCGPWLWSEDARRHPLIPRYPHRGSTPDGWDARR